MTGENGTSADTLLEDWPLRPWLLAALGALAGLAVWSLIDGGDETPWRLGFAAFVFFGAVAAGFTLHPRGLREAAIFSVGLGAVMGGIAFMAADGSERMADTPFAFAAGVFFSVLALPLFQAGFHRRRWATPYAETHFFVWTDAVSAGGALAFVLLSWLLLWLLHGLFDLVGIDLIEQLIDEGWFVGMFMGMCFGAALGVLRDNLSILGNLQRVVMLVFSLLAVPFAAAILIFLAILLASGGEALWSATKNATPILLACALGCFVLSNAVFRDDDASRSGNRIMQAAAFALAFAILPLSAFAAISMGVRINQYGLAPERIWALVAIIIAVTYGVAYWAGLVRGRWQGWSAHLRQANLHLAAATCVLALILALPLFDFGAISASNQIARLKAGKVTAGKFDYNALRWDFGDAGREALARLAKGEGEAASRASKALKQEQRPWRGFDEQRDVEALDVRVQSDDPKLRPLVLEKLREAPYLCREFCVVLDLGANDAGRREVAIVEGTVYRLVTLGEDGPNLAQDVDVPRLKPDSKVEIREMTQRYITIDGKPVGEPLERARAQR